MSCSCVVHAQGYGARECTSLPYVPCPAVMPKSRPTDAEVTTTVFLDMTIGGEPAGRIELGLFGGVVPKTAENFRQ